MTLNESQAWVGVLEEEKKRTVFDNPDAVGLIILAEICWCRPEKASITSWVSLPPIPPSDLFSVSLLPVSPGPIFCYNMTFLVVSSEAEIADPWQWPLSFPLGLYIFSLFCWSTQTESKRRAKRRAQTVDQTGAENDKCGAQEEWKKRGSKKKDVRQRRKWWKVM